MMVRLRPFIQVLFFLVFVAVMVQGKVQVWMLIFAGSFLAAFLLGRFFCGFICPINTLMELEEALLKRLGIKKRKTGFGRLKSPFLRYGLLVLFFALIIITNVTGQKIPLLPVLTVLGAVLSLIYIPELWHRYLCPLGTALQLPGSVSRYSLKVDGTKCNNCDACKKVCPAGAVVCKSGFSEDSIDNSADRTVIEKGLCLECLKCIEKCSKNAIKYS